MNQPLSARDHLPPNISRIRQSAAHHRDHVSGRFESCALDSVFQPIFSLAHKRVVGYEALVRVADPQGRELPPATLFSRKMADADHIFLDRLCRYIHVGNFRRVGDDLNWLFLNVSPNAVASGIRFGPFFRELLEEYDFPSHRVVVEIVEYPIVDQNRILEAVAFYRDLGCLIAIDDFGVGHSNFERIWALSPNIVKMDRSMTIRASSQMKIRQLLPGIVSLLHQAGALVLMEGIETMEQALIALECDADFVQGYFFCRPTGDVARLRSEFAGFDSLFSQFKSLSKQQEQGIEGIYDRYKILFHQAATSIGEGRSLGIACEPLMADRSAAKCYLLRPDGVQIGSTVASTHSFEEDRRFSPLKDARSADWFRRHYLRRAILHPDQLQISRPYLSITGSHMCVTLSMMFSTDWGRMVLCCDLNTDD